MPPRMLIGAKRLVAATHQRRLRSPSSTALWRSTLPQSAPRETCGVSYHSPRAVLHSRRL
jgi:hypothetical protein